MLKSLRNHELSTVSNGATYKTSSRSHVNKSTALLDKSNLQTLEERKIDQIPESVRKKKLHKARKLFAKNPLHTADESNNDKSEIDELDLILMDMHKANEIRSNEKLQVNDSALILMDMRKDKEHCIVSHACDQQPTTQDLNHVQESISETLSSKVIQSEIVEVEDEVVEAQFKGAVEDVVTVDQFLVEQETRRISDQQTLLEDDLVVGKGEFACMGTSKDKMIFSTAIKFTKKVKNIGIQMAKLKD